MTNLNEVQIVACREYPNGEQVAITAQTNATAQLIATVPGTQDQWAESTIEACNIDGSGGVSLLIWLLWGDTSDNARVSRLLPVSSGAATVVDGRLIRGGTKIKAYVTNAAGGAAGANLVNVYVRPFIMHNKSKANETA